MSELTLSSKIKELRGERSFRELERITGISHTYLSSLEKGVDPRTDNERKPSFDKLRQLSEKLDTNYVQLLILAGYLTNHDLKCYMELENEYR